MKNTPKLMWAACLDYSCSNYAVLVAQHLVTETAKQYRVIKEDTTLVRNSQTIGWAHRINKTSSVLFETKREALQALVKTHNKLMIKADEDALLARHKWLTATKALREA